MISASSSTFFEQYDCVVMLTWSNWHTEMRSNRYHFGSRFARHRPVLFVQPDLAAATFEFEPTDVENLEVLHVYREYGHEQTALLNRALNSRGLVNPLLWIYNVYFVDFVRRRYAPAKIYHATEDYFCPDFMGGTDAADIQQKVRETLNCVDLTVAVTDGVKHSFVERGGHQGEIIVSENGCDFAFWRPDEEELKRLSSHAGRRVALYQGGISQKLDFDLLQAVTSALPDWEFQFCGEVVACFREWRALRKRPNVNYLGRLKIEELRRVVHEAAVGIIPFVQNDWIVKRSFPLKAFEYVAAGLPVVSTPVDTLRSYSDVFQFASSAEEFAAAIPGVAPTRCSPDALAARFSAAAQQDYETRFARVLKRAAASINSRTVANRHLKVLILYNGQAAANDASFDELCRFSRSGDHWTFYLPVDRLGSTDLSSFDVVVLHHSLGDAKNRQIVRLVNVLSGFGGVRILLSHNGTAGSDNDEEWLTPLGIHLFISDQPASRDFASRHSQVEYREAPACDAGVRDYVTPIWQFLTTHPVVASGARPVAVMIGTQHDKDRTIKIAKYLIDDSRDVKPLPASVPTVAGQGDLHRVILGHQPIRYLIGLLIYRVGRWLVHDNRLVRRLPAIKYYIGHQLLKVPPAFYVARAIVRGIRHVVNTVGRIGRTLFGRTARRSSA